MLYADVIEDITDQHAVIINRNREASMVLPGETLLVYEMTPALFAAVAANAAERVGAGGHAGDVSMIGAAGPHLHQRHHRERRARARRDHAACSQSVEGREH